MLAWHLGCRYLRRRRAAWLALAAITLTVAMPVVVMGVMQGWVETMAKQSRANESDLTMEPIASGEVADLPALRQTASAVPGVAAVSPFVDTFALMLPKGGDGSYRVPCLVDAMEWSADEAVGRLAPAGLHPAPVFDLQTPPLAPDRRGTGFLTPAWRDHLCLQGLAMMAPLAGLPAALPPYLQPIAGAVVGRELVYGNRLRLGTTVSLTNGGSAKVMVEVSDTIGTGINQLDNLLCLVPLPVGQRMTDLRARGSLPARVAGYRIRCVPGADLHRVSADLESACGMRVRTWMQSRWCQLKFMELQRNILGLVMVCIQVIAVFIVYAVFSTLVAEKRHDIGVLLGLGAQRRQIAGAFLLAGLVACVAGGLLGWAIGWSLLAAINPFTRLTGIPLYPQDVMYTPDAPVSWSPLVPLFFIGVMTVVGLLAVLLPAWRASRIDPIETLRENE